MLKSASDKGVGKEAWNKKDEVERVGNPDAKSRNPWKSICVLCTMETPVDAIEEPGGVICKLRRRQGACQC